MNNRVTMHEQAFEQNLGRDLHQYLASKKLLDARMPECPSGLGSGAEAGQPAGE